MKSLPRSDVEWCDYGWPILRGCSACSEGCASCYAKTGFYDLGRAERFGYPPWGEPTFFPENLDMPSRTRAKSGIVFVAPMSDMFHPLVTLAQQVKIGCQIAKNRHLTFIILTKRPENIAPWWKRITAGSAYTFPNLWLGVSAENQQRFDERWPILLDLVPVPQMLVVSVEPMLGPVSLLNSPAIKHTIQLPDWVICGPETGRRKRPCAPQWIEDLAHECVHTPFFDKRPNPIRREWPI